MAVRGGQSMSGRLARVAFGLAIWMIARRFLKKGLLDWRSKRHDEPHEETLGRSIGNRSASHALRGGARSEPRLGHDGSTGGSTLAH